MVDTQQIFRKCLYETSLDVTKHRIRLKIEKENVESMSSVMRCALKGVYTGFYTYMCVMCVSITMTTVHLFGQDFLFLFFSSLTNLMILNIYSAKKNCSNFHIIWTNEQERRDPGHSA